MEYVLFKRVQTQRSDKEEACGTSEEPIWGPNSRHWGPPERLPGVSTRQHLQGNGKHIGAAPFVRSAGDGSTATKT